MATYQDMESLAIVYYNKGLGSYFHETRNYVTSLNIFFYWMQVLTNLQYDYIFFLSFEIIGSFFPRFSHQSNKKMVKIQQQSKGKSQLTKSLDINVSNNSLNPNKQNI